MIQGALKAIFEAKASFGSTGWIGFAFGAECKGNTGFAVRLQLDHDHKGVFLVGKFVWELKESYEGEYVFWGEQDLLTTGSKYVLSSA